MSIALAAKSMQVMYKDGLMSMRGIAALPTPQPTSKSCSLNVLATIELHFQENYK